MHVLFTIMQTSALAANPGLVMDPDAGLELLDENGAPALTCSDQIGNLRPGSINGCQANYLGIPWSGWQYGLKLATPINGYSPVPTLAGISLEDNDPSPVYVHDGNFIEMYSDGGPAPQLMFSFSRQGVFMDRNSAIFPCGYGEYIPGRVEATIQVSSDYAGSRDTLSTVWITNNIGTPHHDFLHMDHFDLPAESNPPVDRVFTFADNYELAFGVTDGGEPALVADVDSGVLYIERADLSGPAPIAAGWYEAGGCVIDGGTCVAVTPGSGPNSGCQVTPRGQSAIAGSCSYWPVTDGLTQVFCPACVEAVAVHCDN